MNECVLWWGPIGSHGYGVVSHGRGRSYLAHRYIYEETLGKIPEGGIIHHECCNRLCVNPSHMILTTRAEHASKYDARTKIKTHCVKGHEIAKVGRIAGGGCRECHRGHTRRANERRKVVRPVILP